MQEMTQSSLSKSSYELLKILDCAVRGIEPKVNKKIYGHRVKQGERRNIVGRTMCYAGIRPKVIEEKNLGFIIEMTLSLRSGSAVVLTGTDGSMSVYYCASDATLKKAEQEAVQSFLMGLQHFIVEHLLKKEHHLRTIRHEPGRKCCSDCVMKGGTTLEKIHDALVHGDNAIERVCGEIDTENEDVLTGMRRAGSYSSLSDRIAVYQRANTLAGVLESQGLIYVALELIKSVEDPWTKIYKLLEPTTTLEA